MNIKKKKRKKEGGNSVASGGGDLPFLFLALLGFEFLEEKRKKKEREKGGRECSFLMGYFLL